MVAGWAIAMLMCQLAYRVVMSEDESPQRPVVERPVLPVS